MSTAMTVRSVADALEDASRWRVDEESRHKAQMVDVEQQLGELRHSLASIQEKIASLERFRDGMGSKADELRSGEVQRAHDGLFAALAEQQQVLEERTAQLRAAEAKRAKLLESVISGGDMAPKLEEYRQFKEAVEPSLAAMPESYRSVVLGHHEKVAAVLRARISEVMGDPVHADGAPLALEVAFALDPPAEPPEVLVVVAPLAADTHRPDRAEDLQSRLAARLVQAIYEACHEVGLETVQVAAGGHRGLLVVEAEVVGASRELGDVLGARLHKVFRAALELTAAKVEITARRVHADHILGPVDDEEELDVE